jgi:hypothetical protein
MDRAREALAPRLRELADRVRGQVRFAFDIAMALGEQRLAALMPEHATSARSWPPSSARPVRS